jgi:hypothetical protein
MCRLEELTKECNKRLSNSKNIYGELWQVKQEWEIIIRTVLSASRVNWRNIYTEKRKNYIDAYVYLACGEAPIVRVSLMVNQYMERHDDESPVIKYSAAYRGCVAATFNPEIRTVETENMWTDPFGNTIAIVHTNNHLHAVNDEAFKEKRNFFQADYEMLVDDEIRDDEIRVDDEIRDDDDRDVSMM